MSDKNNPQQQSLDSPQAHPVDSAIYSALPEFLPPTDDWVFKVLFGDKRNESILIDLIKAFVELPEEEYQLTFLDTHLKPEAQKEKLGILDVKVQTKSGKIFNVEFQVRPKKNIWQRISFYKSKLIVEQIGKGQDYAVIQRVICICITDHVLFPKAQKYLHHFRWVDSTDNLVLEEIPEEIYIAETRQAPAQDDGSPLWKWMQFFRAQRKEEFEMVAKMSAEIRKAVDTLTLLSGSKRARARYELRLKARRDHKAEMDWAYDDGLEKGLERGLERGRAEGLVEGFESGLEKGREALLETARNALAKGLPVGLIQEITGLDEKTIKSLHEENR